MIRRPAGLPDSEWDEMFNVLEIIGAYKHKEHGRVLEFFTTDRQVRTVAILNIELSPGTIRRLQRMGISHR